MAGARVEKVKSIFQRIEGLYKGKAIAKEDLPIWFDVYKAFPPLVEPLYQRPVPTEKVRKLIYTEDYIRSDFLKSYQNNGAAYNFLSSSSNAKATHMDRYVEHFIDISIKHPNFNSEEIKSKVRQALIAEGISLQTLI